MLLFKNIEPVAKIVKWVWKETVPLQKIYLPDIGRKDWYFFLYNLVPANNCLSDILEKIHSEENFSMQTLRKGNLNQLIFAYFHFAQY